MKIEDYKKGTSFSIDCVRHKNYCGQFMFADFGIVKKFASMWGCSPEEVITVKCTIIEEDVIIRDLMRKDSGYDTKKIDYFGWIEFEDDGSLDISMIYPNIYQYSVCFPYGADEGRFWTSDSKEFGTNEFIHKAGDRRGMTVRLEVTEEEKSASE